MKRKNPLSPRNLLAMVTTSSLLIGTVASADEFALSMSVLDSIAHTVSKAVCGTDYTSYQAQRLGLKRGESFSGAAHSAAAGLALCSSTSTADDWLNQKCKLLAVVPKIGLCTDPSEGSCVVFKLAPFAVHDIEIAQAVQAGALKLGDASPSEEFLERQFGNAKLHGPGLNLSPRADAIARKTVDLRREVHLNQTSPDTYVLTLKPR